MNTDANTRVIDADAHVVECARTWDFMDPSESQYRPIPLETREESGVRLQFWVIDGKVRGFRFPAFLRRGTGKTLSASRPQVCRCARGARVGQRRSAHRAHG